MQTTVRPAPPISGIVVECAQRIDTHRAEGRDSRGRHTDQHQSDRGGEERERISRTYAEQLPCEETAHREVTRHSDGQTSDRRAQPLVRHQPDDTGGDAPIAMRMPISCVRWAARYDMTPYTPAVASRSAKPAKIVSSTMVNRLCQ